MENKTMAMSDITSQKVTTLWEAMQNSLTYLYGRWQDEKGYEDFADYIDVMKKDFVIAKHETNTTNAVFVEAIGTPFRLVFDFEGWRFTFSVTEEQYKWKARELTKKEIEQFKTEEEDG